MARKKRSGTGRRRSASKKGQAKIVANLVGLILAFLMLIGLFNLGVIGQLLVGIFSILVGKSYPVVMALALISGIALTFLVISQSIISDGSGDLLLPMLEL